jgi:hypothetical protein
MEISNFVMILAVLLAPLIAVQVSQLLDRRRDRRQRRFEIFRSLMSTRASKMAPEHIRALNMIDVEFAGNDRKSRDVVNAWKGYLDHLNTASTVVELWASRGEDLFVDLMHTMALALGYEYDKTHIRRTSYYPRGFGDAEWDQLNIRRGIREVLEGTRPIPIWPMQQEPRQRDLSTPQELAQPDRPLSPMSEP